LVGLGDKARHARRHRLLALPPAVAGVLAVPLTALVAWPGAASAPALSIPTTFSGTITVTQHQPAWEDDNGAFSGYTAKAVFAKARFGNGVDGPWTLLRATVSYTGFRVTQTAPDPVEKGGKCVAVYAFSLGTSKTPLGDIGGFSSSHGKWSATVDLGVPVRGRIIRASGCGSGDEFTSHAFGEPPRIDASISATAEFSSSTGKLTLRSTSTSSWEGAMQSDTVTGTLAD
jgi:hypothetical protein